VPEEEPNPGEVVAVVVMHANGLSFRVRLQDGQEVVAVVPKRLAREMFRIVPGDRVRVAGTQTPRLRIMGFAAEG
jgi:translation initiation factor IF-1